MAAAKKKRARRNIKITITLDDHSELNFANSKVEDVRNWHGTEREVFEEASRQTGLEIQEIVAKGAMTEALRLIASGATRRARLALDAPGDLRGVQGALDAKFADAFKRLVEEHSVSGRQITPTRLATAAGANAYRSAKRYLELHHRSHPAVQLPPE